MKKTYLILIILTLVIGFASVSTIIYINGKTNIGANLEDYSIYFSEAYIDDIERLDVISEDKQKITINTKVLKDIGDSEKLEYDVTNASKQYDAKVSITCEPTENEYYEMERVFEHDIIKARTYETGYITIKLKKVSVEEQDLEFTCRLKVEALEKTEANTSHVKKRCKLEEGQVWTFDYKGSEETFEVPCDGTYKLEAWGASGGSVSSYAGGLGGYTNGESQLLQNSYLYINVGGVGASNQKSAAGVHGVTHLGGYNGGGNCHSYSGSSTYFENCGCGGGATHIATTSGLLQNLLEKRDTILLVSAGGGGAANIPTAYWYGVGGAAGGIQGYNGTEYGDESGSANGHTAGKGASQTSGYAFGLGGSINIGGGGGGGYYGGNGGSYAGAGGGSSYISSQLKNTKMIDGQGYEWTTTKGGKINMPTHDGKSTMVGNSGNGYAKITLVSLN